MILSKKRKALYWTITVIFFLYALTLIVPFLYILLNSFKTNGEFIDNAWALPSKLIERGEFFKNYATAFSEYNLLDMFGNTLILTVAGTIIGVMSPTIVAYVLAKYRFKMNGFLFTLAVVFSVIPSIGSTVPLYKMYIDLNLLNTHIGVLLIYAAPFGTYFFLLYSYFKGISWSYAEAVFVDGGNHFTVFFKVMLPQSISGISAIAILILINTWNDYYNPYMFMPNVMTLGTGLQNLAYNAQTTGAYVQMFAAMIVASLPVLILFVCMQKTIMSNVMAGGLKG